MKRFLHILICLLPLSLLAENPIDDDCTFNGIPLRGKVYIYESRGLADINVSIVDRGVEDLRVNKKNCCSDECGEWEFIDNPALADFSICIVPRGVEDIMITFCEVPGVSSK